MLAYTALSQSTNRPKVDDVTSALQILGHTSAVAEMIIRGAQVIIKYRNDRDAHFEALESVKAQLEAVLDDINIELEEYDHEEEWKVPKLEVHGCAVLLAIGDDYWSTEADRVVDSMRNLQNTVTEQVSVLEEASQGMISANQRTA